MIWKTETHEFSATICQKTGKTCPALARMARALVQAVATAGPMTTEAFEIEGTSDLNHCAEGCSAQFHAFPDQIRVFCGAGTRVSAQSLNDYADMMFGTQIKALPGDVVSNPPCAMLQAARHIHHPAPQPQQQAAL